MIEVNGAGGSERKDNDNHAIQERRLGRRSADLPVHTLVYILADYYQVPDLQRLAVNRFADALNMDDEVGLGDICHLVYNVAPQATGLEPLGPIVVLDKFESAQRSTASCPRTSGNPSSLDLSLLHSTLPSSLATLKRKNSRTCNFSCIFNPLAVQLLRPVARHDRKDQTRVILPSSVYVVFSNILIVRFSQFHRFNRRLT